MKIFAIIIARGGSVGIPKKNICEVNGQPLISYTIKQCFESGIEEVYTSSDDDEILEIASSYGSKIIKRPTDISNNTSTSEQAWIHAINRIGNIDEKNNWVFAPQVTSPIRHAEDIEKACSLAQSNKYDSLLSVVEFDDFFLWESSCLTINPINHDYKNRKRRQDIDKKTYLENGSFYMFKPIGLFKYNNRLHGKIGYVSMQKYKMFQIDEPGDIKLAEFFLSHYIS
tara:strand:- start:1515 stop:2195 length:681 start_codon:yes stop_codon:yes gene_type:complete